MTSEPLASLRPDTERLPWPSLTGAEYSRRLQRIRAAMAQRDLDVMILAASTARWEETIVDSRYVAGIGGYGAEALTILGRVGAPTVYVGSGAAWWRSVQRHTLDVRDGGNRWAENIIEWLIEASFQRGRIGLTGLKGRGRWPDGAVPHLMVERLRSAFPEASIADGTALVRDLRIIKSPEEIGLLQRAAQVADRVVDTLAAVARPGVTERQVMAALVHTMLIEGGELPATIGIESHTTQGFRRFVPTDRVLRPGELLIYSIEVRVAGYAVERVQPISIGRPSERHRRLVETAATVFEILLDRMQPGVTLGELMTTYYETLHRESHGTCIGEFPLMHGQGLGDEMPSVTNAQDLEHHAEMRLGVDMVFTVKPRVLDRDGRTVGQIGDTVQVMESGGRRFGHRPLTLIATH